MIVFLLFLLLSSPLAAQELTLVDSASAAVQANNFAEGRRLLNKAIAGGKDDAVVWEIMGFVGQGLKDSKLMIEAGSKLARLAPNNVLGWYFQSIGYHAVGRMDSLIPCAQRFCELDADGCSRTGIKAILKSFSQDSIGRLDSTFRTDDGLMQVILPKSWSARVEDDGKTYHWFVSHQLIRKAEDNFTEGITVRWVRRMSSSFPSVLEGKTDAPFLVGFWDAYVAGILNEQSPYYREVVDSVDITIGVWEGFVRTVDLQVREKSYRLRKLDVILAREDEVLTITLESPAFSWLAYRDRYQQALHSIQLPR